MHELSIAVSLVEIAEQAAAGAKVSQVDVRVGALSGVVPEALRFAYDVATSGTPLEGSILQIDEVPVTIYCAACGVERTLPDLSAMACPACGAPATDIRSGRELEITSLQVEQED